MKYRNFYNDKVVNNDFDNEYRAAIQFGNVRISADRVYKKGLFGIKYVEFSEIKCAFLRKKEATCNTCTAFAVTDTLLVIQNIENKEFTYMTEEENKIKNILKLLESHGVKIGVNKSINS